MVDARGTDAADFGSPRETGTAEFDLGDFARASGCVVVGNPAVRFRRACSDSRDIEPGDLFVALAGERADGHSFVEAALAKGASAVLVSGSFRPGDALRSLVSASGAAAIVAEDPLSALQAAATAYRARFPGLVRVGITGSAGKTTTKECVAAILSRGKRVVRNPGNFNSDIGLPLSMFLIRAAHEVGVFEMGINKPGEMDILARVYEPTLAVVTNIGSAHVGILGSREAIAIEKRKVFAYLRPDGFAVAGEDEPFRALLFEGVKGRMATFGIRSCAGVGALRSLGLDGWEYEYDGVKAAFALPGRHNFLNALAAIRVCELLGADGAQVREGLEGVESLFGRSQIVRGEVTVVQDCYNANAESTLAAMDFCDDVEWTGRKVYVLGSMKELGEEAAREHARVGRAAARSRARALFLYGEEMREAYDAARAAAYPGDLSHYDDFESLSLAVLAYLRPGDLALVKASRSMELERLATRITGRIEHVS